MRSRSLIMVMPSRKRRSFAPGGVAPGDRHFGDGVTEAAGKVVLLRRQRMRRLREAALSVIATVASTLPSSTTRIS
ncbi:hypothetical protein GTO91_15355 [Heliobacterium undosum]|uniref:Uncharacterized protein n=1 Tax=Heliomicrobium undosum TaxID=121734 RepID=A0A845L8Y9_9FIRM|nr:hypothetical protein [Heliomicrobium undosum]MZP31090.1 hypothetical protein [Heliomicrobium undosum]